MDVDMIAIAVALWPDTYPAHHDDTTIAEMLDRARELSEIERTAARYLAALDGRLGPLDTATPESELARLRELLAGTHAHLR